MEGKSNEESIMSQEAQSIFVSMPTVDDPNKTLSLQDAVSLMVCEIQDVKARLGELERWSALTDELATAVRKMQQTFDTLAQQLKGTNVAAKALMNGTNRPRGVN
jgi:hypothetical protein